MKFRVFTHVKDERTPRDRYEGFDSYDKALGCAPPRVWQTQTLEVRCECGHVEILAARPCGASDGGWHASGTDEYRDVICDVRWTRESAA